jgi:hypothetical protein
MCPRYALRQTLGVNVRPALTIIERQSNLRRERAMVGVISAVIAVHANCTRSEGADRADLQQSPSVNGTHRSGVLVRANSETM